MVQTIDFELSRDERHTYKAMGLYIKEGTERVRLKFSYTPRLVEGSEAEEQVTEAVQTYLRQLPKNQWCPEVVLDQTRRLAQGAAQMFTPLRNQLNVSLYDPSGHCWGRWDSTKFFDQWLTVGLQSDWGFESGVLMPGQWCMEIETYGVFSPVLHCQLEIDHVCLNQKTWYGGETHSHTKHSDGSGTPAELFAEAASNGLDFIILSDHNTIAGWSESGGEQPLLVIPGQELTTFYGHAVVSGTKGYVDWRTQGRSDPLNGAAKTVREMGGLFTIAHPFMVGEPLCCGCRWEYPVMDYALVDAIEIWSGSWRKNALFNWMAVQWWDDLLSEGWRITGVGARDIHQLEQLHHADTANTWVEAWFCTANEILEGIRRGRCCVAPQGTVDVTAAAASEDTAVPAMMGDTIVAAAGQPLTLTVAIDALPEPGRLEVVSQGHVVVSQLVGEGSSTVILNTATPQQYLRVQIVKSTDDRTPMMFSNPIYRQT